MKRSRSSNPRTIYVIAVLTAFTLGSRASAQSATDWSYEVGVRSTVMVAPMRLSELGGGFEDLDSGGKALPHSSSIFVMWSRGPHLRLGVETLVGNSYPQSNTQMLFQAAGLLAEYQTGGTWYAAAGLQVGGMIVSATQSHDADAEREAFGSGVHYKESGMFLAPQVSVGRRLRQLDVRLIGKQVMQFGAPGVDAFDSFYAGISVGLLRR